MPEMPDVMRGRVIMHVDMDAFYASVEAARNPRLRTVPFWVGGAERGVVLSANYLARTYGVSGGMASTRARRLCPAGVAVPPDFDHYGAVSAGVFALFDQITDRVEAASIDEAYLDITGSQRRLGSPRLIGENVRARVADEQHITCSVGIAQGRALAKLASNRVKPDGLLVVDPGEVVALLHPPTGGAAERGRPRHRVHIAQAGPVDGGAGGAYPGVHPAACAGGSCRAMAVRPVLGA
ncbi:Y-family DNA polymerase [Propionibacterium freudenreichii]|uniref:Y-family DNA polymerase n=1 Tax=Propionibacterium freudenreichii TaxID=1744 RepID=UPI002549E1C0|nr:DNA polymerase IV [Propionibacterium freudenreichii]